MHLSEARIKANQENAAKSTGPRTVEGKERSRANALKHGLCAKVLSIEDPAVVGARAEEIAATMGLVGGLDGWAAGQVAMNSVRIDRCQAMEDVIRERMIMRAQITWDEDRRLDATRLGDTISRKPEKVAADLRETLHGCEWLMGRWALLARAADVQGSWTPDQTSIAFDLLGTPKAFRDGNRPGAAIDLQGRLVDPAEDQAALARRQVDELIARRDLLRPIDQEARDAAESGMAGELDPELCRLRRYEATLLRRTNWSLKLLQDLSEPKPSAPEPESTDPETPAEPEPAVEEAEPAVEMTVVQGVPSPIASPTRAELTPDERKARRRKLERLSN